MKNELYIIVSQYPYGFGEPFLEEALKVYEHQFDKIYLVIPESKGLDTSIKQFYVPTNAEIIMLDVQFDWYTKIVRSILSITKFDFWEELNYIGKQYKKSLNWGILKQIFAYFGKALSFNKQFSPYLKKSNTHKIIYTFWCTEFTYAAALLKRKNKDIKVVTGVHGWDIYFERSPLNYLPLRKAIFTDIDNIFTVSENGKQYIAHKMADININKILNVYFGTTAARFIETPLATPKFNILSLAFITHVKRVDKLLAALAEINDIDITWTHIGAGFDFDKIKQLATTKLGHKSNIHFSFLGAKTKAEVYELFNHQDYHCIVNTSESEGLPVSLMEALSFGIPVIAPAVGGIPEMIIEGYNGLQLSSKFETQELVNAITDMATMPADAYRTMRHNAYAVWQEKFNAKDNFTRLGNYLLTEKAVAYQQCTKCILDSHDYPEISFDEVGICTICKTYDDLSSRTILHKEAGKHALDQLLVEIKEYGKGKEYDCLIGVSGGVDSSYLAWLTKEWKLRPLVSHVDNGWNTELAVSNIESLLNKLGYDLFTYVIDWDEMRDLQHAFIKANVVDIDLPFDNAFMAILYRLAAKYKIKYILSGHNTATEGYLPPNFTHNKMDSVNIRDIHKQFGTIPLKSFPIIGRIEQQYFEKVKNINIYTPLNWMDYNKADAKKLITEDLGWRDYGGKHYENIYTRFYQGHILYEKFHIDKRKSHLSTLICSGQIKKVEALEEIMKPPYPNQELLKTDREFFLKKMRMTEAAFAEYIHAPAIPHTAYRSYENTINRLRPYYRMYKSIVHQ